MIAVARGGPRKCLGNCDGIVTRKIDGRFMPLCDDCLSATVSEWSGHVSSTGAASRLRNLYGLAVDDHAKMFTAQGGLCAICRSPERSSKEYGTGLVVDHDHETGEVRELLCGRCNSAIGMLNDDPAWMMAAAAYINKHTERERLKAKRLARRAAVREHMA